MGRDADGVGVAFGVELDIEEFAAVFGDDVDREGRTGRAAEHGAEPGGGAESGEGPFEGCNIHVTTLVRFAGWVLTPGEADEWHSIRGDAGVRGDARWGERGKSASRRLNADRSDPFRSVPKGCGLFDSGVYESARARV